MLTPIMVALQKKNKEIVKMLLQNDAKPFLEDASGKKFSAEQFAKECGAEKLLLFSDVLPEANGNCFLFFSVKCSFSFILYFQVLKSI